MSILSTDTETDRLGNASLIVDWFLIIWSRPFGSSVFVALCSQPLFSYPSTTSEFTLYLYVIIIFAVWSTALLALHTYNQNLGSAALHRQQVDESWQLRLVAKHIQFSCIAFSFYCEVIIEVWNCLRSFSLWELLEIVSHRNSLEIVSQFIVWRPSIRSGIN